MYQWGIKQRVLLLALVPTITISLLLGVYFTSIRLQDLNQALQDRGDAIASRLAPAAEYGVLIGSANILSNLARNALEEDEVSSVGFYTRNGDEIVALGKRITTFTPPVPTSQENLTSTIIETAHTISFVVPISSRDATQEDDFDEDDYLFDMNMSHSDRIYGWLKVDLERSTTRLQEYQVLIHSSMIVLFGLSISGLLAIRMGHNVASPILQLAKAVEKIKQGNLNTTIETNAQWEIKELESGINTMANALHAAHTELQNNIEQATADLRHTLETIEIQNIELEIARKEAETASRVKSEFLANMSHELRTPLNGILGFISLLQKTEVTTRQRDFLTTIHKSATTLLAIINDILDFSKIEAGKLTIEQTPMDIRECVEDALTLLAPSAHEKAIELVPFVYDDVPERIIGDPLRLKQLLTNLVSNGIKFTEQGSVVVRVMLEQENDNSITLCVSVTDTGIGLSKEQQNRLFNAFNQVSSDARRRYGGTGLGLVICKKLVEQMNGSIDLESSPGKGSKFWFTFLTKKTEIALPKPPKQLDKMRILLYERHPVTRLVLLHMLQEWGIEIDEIDHPDNIDLCLKKAKDEGRPFHLTLLGLNQLNRHDTFVEDIIQRLDADLKCPVGILVNTTDHFVHSEILKIGAFLCLAKPVCRKKLYDALSECFYKDSPNNEVYPTSSSNDLFIDNEIHVLAVDDNPANLKLVCALLDELGVHATGVSSGLAAIDACRHESFHLIIMDIQMPEMDGIETTRAIRKIEGDDKQTPVVALSAHAMITQHDALIAAGLNDFLTKPVSEHELRAVIYKWTQRGIGVIPPQPEIKPPEVTEASAIDWNVGESLAGGKRSLAEEMLRMLVTSLPNDKEKIQQAYLDNDYSQLRDHVHKLHGGCCYCGVPTLKKIVKTLEDDIIDNHTEQVDKGIEALFIEIERVIQASKGYLSEKAAPETESV